MSEICYAVLIGKNPGIYKSWKEVQRQVKGFVGASYKKFASEEEAWKELGIEFGDTKALELRQTELLSNTLSQNIYIDGSFDYKEKIYSYAFAVVENNEIIYSKSGSNRDKLVGNALNSAASELKAAMMAVKYAATNNHRKNVVIYHDNLLVSRLITGSLQPKNKYELKYKEFVNKTVKESGISLSFTKVKAHNGNDYNEFVDSLAKMEMRIKRDGFKSLKEKNSSLSSVCLYNIRTEALEFIRETILDYWNVNKCFGNLEAEKGLFYKKLLDYFKQKKIVANLENCQEIIDKALYRKIIVLINTKAIDDKGYNFLEDKFGKDDKKQMDLLISKIHLEAIKVVVNNLNRSKVENEYFKNVPLLSIVLQYKAKEHNLELTGKQARNIFILNSKRLSGAYRRHDPCKGLDFLDKQFKYKRLVSYFRTRIEKLLYEELSNTEHLNILDPNVLNSFANELRYKINFLLDKELDLDVIKNFVLYNFVYCYNQLSRRLNKTNRSTMLRVV